MKTSAKSTSDLSEGISQMRCSKSQRREFLPLLVYVLYLAASFVVPSEGKIFREAGRQSYDLIIRDFEAIRGEMPPSATGRGGESRRQRARRSPSDLDFIEFRRLLHRLRNKRRGARTEVIDSRRNMNEVFERDSTENSIAKTVKCGECELKRQWAAVTKPGCRTNYCLIPSCMGMCETWQIPDVDSPYVTTHHRVCRPTQLEYRKIRLRRCNPEVNPFHILPIVKNCACLKIKREQDKIYVQTWATPKQNVP